MKYIFLLLVVLSFAYSCSGVKYSKEVQNIVLTDVQGNEVQLKGPAERVVCLFDPAVDVIYMLQMQHKLVGIPAEMYSDKELFEPYSLIDVRVREKSLAIPGSNETANIESIISLHPDLVIAQHISDGTRQTLRQMGIAVYLASSEKYEQVLKELADIGRLTGATDRAAELLSYTRSQFETLQNHALHLETDKRKRVYFTWANGRIFSTTGRNSMMNDCLEFAGVTNVCDAPLDQPNINAETLIRWNPDMIVMWNDPPQLFYNRKELWAINAVQQKKIFNLMPMYFYNPHTIKSLAASKRIQHWADGLDEAASMSAIKETIIKIYGEEAGQKLIILL